MEKISQKKNESGKSYLYELMEKPEFKKELKKAIIKTKISAFLWNLFHPIQHYKFSKTIKKDKLSNN